MNEMTRLVEAVTPLAEQLRVDGIILGEAAVRSYQLKSLVNFIMSSGVAVTVALVGITVWLKCYRMYKKERGDWIIGTTITGLATALFTTIFAGIAASAIPGMIEPLGSLVRDTLIFK